MWIIVWLYRFVLYGVDTIHFICEGKKKSIEILHFILKTNTNTFTTSEAVLLISHL